MKTNACAGERAFFAKTGDRAAFVVIVGKAHPRCAARKLRLLFFPNFANRGGGFRALQDFGQIAVHLPRIIDVERFDEQIGLFGLGEPDRIRLDFIDLRARLVPKIGRDQSVRHRSENRPDRNRGSSFSAFRSCICEVPACA